MVHNTTLFAFYMQDKDEQFHNCAQVATWMLILLKKEWFFNIIFISNDTFQHECKYYFLFVFHHHTIFVGKKASISSNLEIIMGF
jgi:hypothetical protein